MATQRTNEEKVLDELADNLEATIGEAEDILERRDAGGVSDLAAKDCTSAPASKEEEAKCKQTLKKYVHGATGTMRTLTAQLNPMQKRLAELNVKEQQLLMEKRSAMRSVVSGQLQRVGAPEDVWRSVGGTKLPDDLMMAVATQGAGPEPFNALKDALCSECEWQCTLEATTRPQKDLLGMCPGGKPHILEEARTERNEDGNVVRVKRCYCDICVLAEKLVPVREELKKLRKKVPPLQKAFKSLQLLARRGRSLLQRLGGHRQQTAEDLVFYEEGAEPEGHTDQWENLRQTLTEDDLPLRIVFLDKSGSMSGDEITFGALMLGLQNALYPKTGSTLCFLFAGPGETQAFYRRPGDSPVDVQFELGCATWFNEPVQRTLRFLAPILEKIDVVSWTCKHGRPPVEVLCITDGQDNASPDYLKTLQDLVRELKNIKRSDSSSTSLYNPVVGPLVARKKREKAIRDGDAAAEASARAMSKSELSSIPVWMAWVAVGMGGQGMLSRKAPKEICVIDACAAPILREAPAQVALPNGSANRAAEEEEDSETDEADEAGSKAEEVATPEQRRRSRDASTAASRARQRKAATQCSHDMSLGDETTGMAAEAAQIKPIWKIGHRVRVKAAEPGRAPRSALVMNVLVGDSGEPKYEVLFDDESTDEVMQSQLVGKPFEETRFIRPRKPQGGRSAGKASPGHASTSSTSAMGIMARTAEPDMQRAQVFALVDKASSDLSLIMNNLDTELPRKGPVSMEESLCAINSDGAGGSGGGAEVSPEELQRLLGDIAKAESTMKMSSEPVEPPMPTAEALLKSMQSIGSSCARLMPEDRLLAQRLLGAGIELLMCGGSLLQKHFAEQLNQFAGLSEATQSRRMQQPGGQGLEELQRLIAGPLESLLSVMMKRGILEATETIDGISLAAAPGARPCLAALRRFVDPQTTRSGVEDSLRRAVTRTQRLRPAFSFAGGREEKQAGSLPAASTSTVAEAAGSSRSSSRSLSKSQDALDLAAASGGVAEFRRSGSSSRPTSGGSMAGRSSSLGGSQRLPALTESATASMPAFSRSLVSLERGSPVGSRSPLGSGRHSQRSRSLTMSASQVLGDAGKARQSPKGLPPLCPMGAAVSGRAFGATATSLVADRRPAGASMAALRSPMGSGRR
eukprot:TRINITY_DN5459_c0_g1_i1.p1 TRINITY_DN5459_c0_g1~~TRINITY_DN5459_c0_g1_i1.p1  ORF type:complete len:1146 (+),score=223.72 TRINITY_DN5459_c0_g1_i1:80-3517(+)